MQRRQQAGRIGKQVGPGRGQRADHIEIRVQKRGIADGVMEGHRQKQRQDGKGRKQNGKLTERSVSGLAVHHRQRNKPNKKNAQQA